MIGDKEYIAAVKGLDEGRARQLLATAQRTVDTLVGSSMRNGHPVDAARFGRVIDLYATLAERRLGLSPEHARAYMGTEVQSRTHAYVLEQLTSGANPVIVAKLGPLREASLYGDRMIQGLMVYAMRLGSSN